MLKEIYWYPDVIEFDSTERIKKRDIKKIGIPNYEIHRAYNWYKKNGEYYYIKAEDTLAEFIGEFYADQLELATAHYFPVRCDSTVKIASKNFKQSGTIYYDYDSFIDKYGVDGISLILTDDFKKLREALIKLFAVDIMMGQYDRNEANIWIQENKDGISLAPVFDYSASLSLSKYLEYITPIKEFKLFSNYFKYIANNNPKLYEYLIYLLSIENKEIYSNIEDKHGKEILPEYKEMYDERIDRCKILVRDVLNERRTS